MKRHARARARPLAPMAACLAFGIAIGWWLRATGGPRPSLGSMLAPDGSAETRRASPPLDPEREVEPPVLSTSAHGADNDAIDELRTHRLQVPIDGVKPSTFKGGFSEARTGDGGHPHDAVDIHAPKNTPVHAVESGTIAKLFESRAGGHTVYQFDPSERFCYYYAHLDHYAAGLHQGQRVVAGEVIAYVGTSGNAPPTAPHLHFAIFELGPDRRWWQGKALDPYLAFR